MFSAPLQVLAWTNCHSSLHSNCTLQVVGNAAEYPFVSVATIWLEMPITVEE
jgi:hypothetical protein